jgi:hypothetical protein
MFENTQQNRKYGEKKLDTPILATGGEAARVN